ncbi:M23 family metallopeptidase [Microbacterium sp. LRZ72]|uniref:M23 family metallopeptidase n=1 Tax=Microbacterium sp. LRZ72 TaxID=2942481 RepID=UPI0029A93AF9|nr:M23 family metallopeptidase [Microbacterium sp. LRZ72]MDX2377714.1 M23 family metallopeptidase [Microbacterium sp. LRZ72]
MSVTAMASAVALTISLALPATAAQLPATDEITKQTNGSVEQPQALDPVIRADTEPLDRGTYLSESAATNAVYAQTASTFVNYRGEVQWPFLTGVPISSGFGMRPAPCAGCPTDHRGIDMSPGAGSPIQSIADGVVREVSATDAGELGVYAIIDHVVDGERVSSLYAHMAIGTLALRAGDAVSVGDLVGNVGNSGLSGGPHLHLGLMRADGTYIDPYAWLSARVKP